jgi:hypothetical protein
MSLLEVDEEDVGEDETVDCMSSRTKKTSEQIRIIVRTKSYCSRNNFVCHLEQKQMYYQNKGSEQVVIISRTRYL